MDIIKQIVSFVLVIALALSSSGCYSLHTKSTSPKPVITGPMPEGYKFLQHVSEAKYQIYIFWGLLPLKMSEQDDVFMPYLRNGDAIANVQNHQERGIVSFVVSIFLYGFIQVLQTDYQGDLIRKA